MLQQYDTPAEVLGHPATAFVGDFIGADRGLRRLAVTPIEVTDLYTPPAVGPRTTVDEARAAVEAGGTRWAVVVSDEGSLLGWVEPAGPPEGSRLRTAPRPSPAICALCGHGSASTRP